MAVFVNETFTAANGTDVTALSGWAEHTAENTGAFSVQANRVYPSSILVMAYNTASPGSADYSVEAVLYIASTLTGAKVGVVGRLDTSALTFYEVRFGITDSKWVLQRVVNGQNVAIGNYVQTPAPTAGTSYTVKLDMVGSVINVYVDGTLRISVDDSTAPITAAGKAGIEGFGAAAGGATGIHVDSLVATDASAPAPTISYVGVGTQSNLVTTGNLTPGLPSGLAVDDLMVATIYMALGSGNVTIPTGWTQIAAPVGGGGKTRVATRFYQSGDAAPSIAITAAGEGGIAQIAAFRGIDKATPIDVTGTTASGSGTDVNVGPIPGITPSVAKALVLVTASRSSDFSGVATLTGDSLTWNEIAEAHSATPGNGLGIIWDYAIFAGNPTAVTAKTFTMPSGTGTWAGVMVAFRPGGAPAPSSARQAKFRSGGSFSTAKPWKRRASGTFATKPAKVIGIDKPPDQVPTGGPGTYTIQAVTVDHQDQQLTYTPSTPASQLVFPQPTGTQVQPLTFQFHQPPPNEQGMKVMMWDGLQNFQNLAPADLAAMKGWGIDGFHLMAGAFVGAGGASPPAPTAWIDQLNWAQDFADGHPEFDVRFGIQARNYYEAFTPWAPFWNDNLWDTVIFPGFDTVGHAIRDSALTGVTVDGENYGASANSYPQGSGTVVPTGDDGTGLPDGGSATIVNGNAAREGWRWNTYFGEDKKQRQGGNRGAPAGYTEATVRAKLNARAVQVANTLASAANATAANPVRFNEYHLYMPGGFWDHEQIRVNKKETTGEFISDEWIDGLTSDNRIVFRFIDSSFYKTAGDDASYKENLNGIEDPTHPAGPYPSVAHPGTTFQWDGIGWENRVFGARPNAFCEPFIWITGGPKCNFGFGNTSDCQRDDSYIAVQLQQARKWTQGAEFTLYNTATFPAQLSKYNTAIQAAIQQASV